MATIDDIRAVERLMQTLDENPALLEAVRSRVLTRELLELPQQHARLTERVDQIAEQLAQLTERVGQLTAAFNQFAANTDRRLEAMERGIHRLQVDFGTFRSEVAVNTALRNSAAIAVDLGLTRTGEVSQDELVAMARASDTAGIPGNYLRSFYLADLVLKAVDDDGRQHYIAVEASHTADMRDTRRAIRNAHYLTRFTGHPAHAVVVAMRIDWEIEGQIASGEVHLFQLKERNQD